MAHEYRGVAISPETLKDGSLHAAFDPRYMPGAALAEQEQPAEPAPVEPAQEPAPEPQPTNEDGSLIPTPDAEPQTAEVEEPAPAEVTPETTETAEEPAATEEPAAEESTDDASSSTGKKGNRKRS